MKFIAAIAVLSASFLSAPVSAVETNQLPVEAFASLDSFIQMKISPDGERYAVVSELDGRKAVVVRTMTNKVQSIIPAPDGGDFDTFYWANNDVILLQLSGTLNRVEFRTKTRETRVHAFNLKKKKFTWLGEPNNRRKTATSTRGGKIDNFASQNERIVDFLPDEPNYILMQMDFDLDAESSVYRVDVRNGKRKEIRRDRRGIQNWFVDQNSEIRLGYGYHNSDFVITLRDANGEWLDVEKADWLKAGDFIEGFAEDPNIIYIRGRTQFGTDGIFTVDLRTGERKAGLFAHEKVDLDWITEHPITGKISGVAYTTDYRRVKFFDKKLAKIQRSIAKALPNEVVTIASMAREKERYIIHTTNDRDPGAYYLYDRDKGALDLISPLRNIYPEDMAKTVSFDIPVRDGSTIPAFMTTPAEAELASLPTIILPHGGPGARDSAHWDWWAQFYANRGYLVLKPNFRGSTGYGDAYRFKGFNQWGGLMQNDVTDATKWAISEGYADPERICIAGASYGGYAALMGAIMEQGLYKCAISVNGVTDLPRLKSGDKQNSVGGSTWIKTMGLKDAEDETVSPIDRAEEINIPVLLMSSVDDARVPYAMSRAMHEKLEKLGKESRYVKIEDGTHNMVTKASRMALLGESEKFLAKHLGGRQLTASK